MYIRLMESYVRWFEARGESFASARFALACALGFAALFNVTALTILLQLAGGFRVSDWFADNLWADFSVAGILVGVHWWLGGRIPPSAHPTPDTPSRRSPQHFPWAWYMASSLGLWCLTISAAIVRNPP